MSATDRKPLVRITFGMALGIAIGIAALAVLAAI